jgi:hypothetical protein
LIIKNCDSGFRIQDSGFRIQGAGVREKTRSEEARKSGRAEKDGS